MQTISYNRKLQDTKFQIDAFNGNTKLLCKFNQMKNIKAFKHNCINQWNTLNNTISFFLPGVGIFS